MPRVILTVDTFTTWLLSREETKINRGSRVNRSGYKKKEISWKKIKNDF